MKNVKFVTAMLMVLVLIVSVAAAEYVPSPEVVPIVPVHAETDDGIVIPIVREDPSIILTTLSDEDAPSYDRVSAVYNELVEAGSVAVFCETHEIVSDLVDFTECNAVVIVHFKANGAALALGADTPVTLIVENSYGLASGEYHAIRMGDDGINEVVTTEVTDTEIHIPATIGNLGTYTLLDR